jgi:hypothetical protein
MPASVKVAVVVFLEASIDNFISSRYFLDVSCPNVPLEFFLVFWRLEVIFLLFKNLSRVYRIYFLIRKNDMTQN